MNAIGEYYRRKKKTGRSEIGPRGELVRRMIEDHSLLILDLGCGDGRLAAEYKKTSNRVWGVEINPEQRTRAAGLLERVLEIDLEGEWSQLEGGVFDLVVMSAVVEHIFDYRHLFAETARVLKPGGALIVATPNAASLRSRLELISGRVPAWYRNFEHIRLWTRSWLRSRLEEHGFQEEYFTGCFVRPARFPNLLSAAFPTLAPLLVARYRRRG